MKMLSDLKSLERSRRESSGSTSPSGGRRTPPSPKTDAGGKKSSLFTVDSLLASHHQNNNNNHHHHNSRDHHPVHEFSDLSPPATPPSPAIVRPSPMSNSPLFAHYPFGPYGPGNLLIPGLPFPHPASIHSWSGIKFPSSGNHHLSDAPSSKYMHILN